MIEFRGMLFCPNCREYKGLTEDDETGEVICVFCE